jgi:hypothetical protein
VLCSGGLPTPRRRQQLIDQLDLWPQTIARWRRWWRGERGRFIPPIEDSRLPGTLLDRLIGTDLRDRLCLLLRLVSPITTASWSGSLRLEMNPQMM